MKKLICRSLVVLVGGELLSMVILNIEDIGLIFIMMFILSVTGGALGILMSLFGLIMSIICLKMFLVPLFSLGKMLWNIERYNWRDFVGTINTDSTH